MTTEQLTKPDAEMPVNDTPVELSVKKTEEQLVVASEDAVKEKPPTPAKSFIPGPATIPTDRTAQKAMILRQVEFYFGDCNLPKDEYLWKVTRKTPEGWVNLDLISSFKRMRRFSDRAIVVEALKESKELLELSEDNSMVRRKTALVYPQLSMERAIYVKGLGEETDTLQDELDDFFAQFGTCLEVRMRRDDDKAFKGSLFVEYSNVEEAEKLVNSGIEYKGTKLEVMSKGAYCDMKAKEKGIDMKNRVHDPTKPRPFSAWKEMAQAARAAGKKEGQHDGKQEDKKQEYEKGCLLRFRCPDNVQWKKIKDVVGEKAPVRFVTFDEGSNNSGVACLTQPKAETLVKDFESTGFEIEGGKIEVSAMDADGEALWHAANKRRDRRDGGGRGGRGGRGQRGSRGGNRGGNRGGDRKRKGEQEGDSTEKRTKIDV